MICCCCILSAFFCFVFTDCSFVWPGFVRCQGHIKRDHRTLLGVLIIFLMYVTCILSKVAHLNENTKGCLLTTTTISTMLTGQLFALQAMYHCGKQLQFILSTSLQLMSLLLLWARCVYFYTCSISKVSLVFRTCSTKSKSSSEVFLMSSWPATWQARPK